MGPVLAAVFLIVAGVFCYAPIHNNLKKWHHGERGSKDYPLWFETGRRMLGGATPYVPDKNGYPFTYPPSAAALLAVGAAAGRLPLVGVQVVVNTVAWAVAVVVPAYLLTGRRRPRDVPVDPVGLLFWVPSLMAVGYIWNTYLEGQPAFLLSAVLMVMFVCLRRGNAWGAGLSLAVATALKGTPILALPYLLWRRQWRAAGYAVGFLSILVLAGPLPFRGTRGTAADLRTWFGTVAARQTPTVIGQRVDRSYTWQNGSLTSVAHRWLRPIDADADPPPLRINVADVPFDTVQRIVMVLTALFGLAYVAVMPWRDRDRTAYTDAVEQAMLLILIVLFSPLSFTYNTSWLMLGIAAVIWFALARARTRGQTVVAVVWLGAVALLLVPTIGGPFRAWRARGNTCLADLLMLAELAWILIVERVYGPVAEDVEPRRSEGAK